MKPFVKALTKLSLIIIFLLLLVKTYSQNYIVKNDSSTFSGINLVEGNKDENSQFCILKRGNGELIKYTPDSLLKYGFKNGRKFISDKIVENGIEKKVFLEILFNGKIKLYRYVSEKSTIFFIEKNQSISELNASTLDSQLKELFIDCKEVEKAVKEIKYNSRSLELLAISYESCNLWGHRRTDIGLHLGYEYNSFKSGSNLRNLDFNSSHGIKFGLFANFPLSKKIYIHPELNFSNYSFVSSENTQLSSSPIKTRISTVSIPFLIKYKLSTKKDNFYLDGGISYNQNIVNNNESYKNFVGSNIDQAEIVSPIQLGFIIGIGVELGGNYKHSISFEVRYNKVTSPFDPDNSISNDAIQFIMGFNF
jgi:hypothetical protein